MGCILEYATTDHKAERESNSMTKKPAIETIT